MDRSPELWMRGYDDRPGLDSMASVIGKHVKKIFCLSIISVVENMPPINIYQDPTFQSQQLRRGSRSMGFRTETLEAEFWRFVEQLQFFAQLQRETDEQTQLRPFLKPLKQPQAVTLDTQRASLNQTESNKENTPPSETF
ncbi:hypothetical protein MMC07_009255 [Pseudocyphellaria aurata]|nr:hypothetical protein [Pseudocyphellaria aurata]